MRQPAISRGTSKGQGLRTNSGSLAMFAAILRASSFVISLAADRRPGQQLFG
jgi:hypothetical protein